MQLKLTHTFSINYDISMIKKLAVTFLKSLAHCLLGGHSKIRVRNERLARSVRANMKEYLWVVVEVQVPNSRRGSHSCTEFPRSFNRKGRHICTNCKKNLCAEDTLDIC